MREKIDSYINSLEERYRILGKYLKPILGVYFQYGYHEKIDTIFHSLRGLSDKEVSLGKAKDKIIELMMKHDLQGNDAYPHFASELKKILDNDTYDLSENLGANISRHKIEDESGKIVSEGYKVGKLDGSKSIIVFYHGLLVGPEVRIPTLSQKELQEKYDLFAPHLFGNKYGYGHKTLKDQREYVDFLCSQLPGKKIIVSGSHGGLLARDQASDNVDNEAYIISGAAGVEEKRTVFGDHAKYIRGYRMDDKYSDIETFSKYEFEAHELGAVPHRFIPALARALQDEEKFFRKFASARIAIGPSIKHEKEKFDKTKKGDAFKKMSRIKKPVQVIAGSKDKMVSPEIQRQMHDRIEMSEYDVVEGGSHGFYVAHPEKLTKELVHFIEDCILNTYEISPILKVNAEAKKLIPYIQREYKNDVRLINLINKHFSGMKIQDLQELTITKIKTKYKGFGNVSAYRLNRLLIELTGFGLRGVRDSKVVNKLKLKRMKH